MTKPWRPGHQRFPSGVTRGRIGQDVFLLASMGSHKVMGRAIPPSEPDMELDGRTNIEVGTTVLLMLVNAASKNYTLSLTTLTEQELDAFKDAVIEVIESARPVCKARDQKAEEAATDEGFDSATRRNRIAPTVSRIAREIRTHD